MSFVRQHKGALISSLTLHVAAFAAMAIGVPWPERPRVAVAMAPIQGVIIDQATVQREREEREQAARAQRQRQQRVERERREAAEQQRVAVERREQERVAAEQRARDDAQRKERERVAAEKREQERRDEQRREQQARAEREQREKEAAAAAAAQRRREAELQDALAVESERAQAEAAGLLEQYLRMIENRIKQHWDRPLSARPGIDCVVNVVQLPTGDVVSAKVGACNGDDAVRRSIERAVMDASPLPRPPTPALFERSLNIFFQPDE